MAAISCLTSEMLQELKALFDLFDADGDGHLEVEEVSAICSSCGIALTEAEVLDMVTELKPDIRKLPFEEFVNMISRPMVDRPVLEAEVAETFPTFAGESADSISTGTLQAGMASLGRPIDPLVASEMIREATKGGEKSDGKISKQEYISMNSIDATRFLESVDGS